ncbi:hypothetical protein [Streptomyces sp. NPDC046832]|uniref:hypothetical protein n=1 Tax=Streptomyces sp. NPDC046832 TaxID=3155020 RepID=UPI0033E90B77
MPKYEVLQVEARSGNVEASLPFTGLSYSETINAAGSATVTIPLDAADPAKLVVGRSALVPVADGEPVWGGLLWGATADLAAGTLTLNASGWHSYYDRRYLVRFSLRPGSATLGKWTGYTARKERSEMLRDWFDLTAAGGIDTDTSMLTERGFFRKRDWSFAEFKNMAEGVAELAEEGSGFDFWYETVWRNSARTRVANRVRTRSRLSRTFPTLTHRSNADVTQVSYDGTKLASRAWAFGADDGKGSKPLATRDNTLDTPTLHQVTTFSDVKGTAELQPKASAMAAAGKAPIAIPTLTVYPGLFRPSQFMPGAVGYVKASAGYVRLNDDYVLTERNVNVNENGTESISLALASKEVFLSDDSS